MILRRRGGHGRSSDDASHDGHDGHDGPDDKGSAYGFEARDAIAADPGDSADFGDDDSEFDADTDTDTGATPRRWWQSSRRERERERGSTQTEVTPDDLDLKPVTMRGPEALYGYIVALELIGVSVLNLTVTHGKGAPTHPSTEWAVIGLVASMALIPIVRTHHRLIVGFAAIIAAFFATLPKVPQSLSTAHLLALIIPVVYAFLLTQRQRKAATAQPRAGRTGATRSAGAAGQSTQSGRSTPADRRAQAGGGRRARRKGAVPSGPQANRRYTPPKSKRPRR
jgi:hypothetical protein